ncbi:MULTISPECIES: hypothetical protein [Empedobacter]|uniref:Uncharacterized protein n=1 Tax=Empedobacter falsenii TaxID=343874 RepID=A0A7H9DUE9_9FLAO|nr:MULTISPECIES: hypothetical protein [Empedobacter]MDH2205895.1 hypothetical protein [Empedobacter sp. GD03644]QLL58812.1 hypothetical protein FH779_12220 [Empedobacter falsenii]
MTRIILQNDNINLDTSKKSTITAGFISDRDILRKRSKKYMDLIAGLDAKTLTETKGMEELMNCIQEEFGTAELASLPLGIVSKCFLGHPYEVHTLDLIGNQIIKHYKSNEIMEGDFEKARTVAMHNAYAMVEVYTDKMILIREDGTASKL